ncbi:hypothetical protein T10_6470 [Trichinella papuae]|uniref:Uncharacterized protein n=1 Tax=Trichinella papuae TaxID=268474 RepID=A0A0V1MBP1_9BILA|nr:hypothetical protein T10_6470 [Trichinella papuae]
MALNLCTIAKKCNSLLKRTIRFEKLKFHQQLFPASCDYTNRMSKLDSVNWSLIIDMLYAEWHLNESVNKKLFHEDFPNSNVIN